MFIIEDTRWSAAPSSSPPSSPTAYNDSSPASSPAPEDFIPFPDAYDPGHLGRVPSHASPPPDPFAASAKGSWVPPEYEKGGKKIRRMSPSSPTRSRVKKPRLLGPEASLETVVAHSPRPSISLTEAEKETIVWDAALARVFDNGNGIISLPNSNLSSIPESVADLHRFCVLESPERWTAGRGIAPFAPPPPPRAREFVRSSTAPAILGSGPPFSRVTERAVGVAGQEIQFHLACNQILRIPLELLGLDKLTVLSLRANKLKTVPPEIQNLRNLHTLNVSGNQLQYLPSEISDMASLRLLHVFPNNFINPEDLSSTKREFRRAKSAQGRVAVSSTSRLHGCVPPLVELAFRSMFSAKSAAHTATNYEERRLAQYYELPLCEEGEIAPGSSSSKKEFRKLIPTHLRRVLDAIHPGSVDRDLDEPTDPDDRPSLGICPSPRHGPRKSIFVTPAEERFTWETVVAGIDVGGEVPLKWRGCLWGCLDFLDAGVESEKSDVDETAMEVDEAVAPVIITSSEGLDFDDD